MELEYIEVYLAATVRNIVFRTIEFLLKGDLREEKFISFSTEEADDQLIEIWVSAVTPNFEAEALHKLNASGLFHHKHHFKLFVETPDVQQQVLQKACTDLSALSLSAGGPAIAVIDGIGLATYWPADRKNG